MPNSVRENDNDVRAFVATHVIDTALDVGPGEGTYNRMLGDLIPNMDAVEIWSKNISLFDLDDKYREVWHDDIRVHIESEKMKKYDLIIFGDVLEHMPLRDAVDTFTHALYNAAYVLVSVPIIDFPQGAIDGNHHETHHIENAGRDLIPHLGKPLYSFRYNVTGTFIYKGVKR